MVHRRTHAGTAGDTTPRPRVAASNVRAGGVPSLLHPATLGRSSHRRPPSAPRPSLRRSSPAPNRLGRSPRVLPKSTKPTTLTRPTRRWDGSLTSTTATRSPNTAKSWTPSSLGEKKSWPITPADEHRTDHSKGSTTCSRSYDESLTDSPTTTTTTTTPPAESS